MINVNNKRIIFQYNGLLSIKAFLYIMKLMRKGKRSEQKATGPLLIKDNPKNNPDNI